MNRTAALGRKIVYLVILVAMLVPLYFLGQPSGGGSDPGGRLTEMRGQFNIAESDLGEINPASETMKLASLGLRGVAAGLLWEKSHTYKIMHEWDRLKATLNNIALLQPHFDKVWEFQAHNLAYNVSTEFDDYRQRYEMVREGTEYLTRGVRQNRNAPRLVWYTGWFYGSKMGMSDEKAQFRRLFSDDEVLHAALLKEGIAVDSPEARGPLGKPDNWLVGRLWLNYGYDLVDSGVKIRRQTPLNFYETGPKWRFKHAEAIEKEGILDDRAQNAWTLAAEDWSAFGNRSIPTTSPFTIKLDQLDELLRQRAERIEKLKEVTGEAFVSAEQKLVDGLPQEYKDLLAKPTSELTVDERIQVEAISQNLVPDFESIARAADPSVRIEAIRLVAEIADLNERRQKTEGYRNQINYPYWKALAQAEQEERTVEARRLIYEAEKANAEAELDKAIELYEKSFVIWAQIFDDYPILTIDDSAEDLFDSIRRYIIAIDTQELPENFPLTTFVEMMGRDGSVDSQAYERVRVLQKEKAEQRRLELAEEERRREAEAKEAEKPAAEAEKPESASPAPADAEAPASTEAPAEAMEKKPEPASEPSTDADAAAEKESAADTEPAAEKEPAAEPSSEEPAAPSDAETPAEPAPVEPAPVEAPEPAGEQPGSSTDE